MTDLFVIKTPPKGSPDAIASRAQKLLGEPYFVECIRSPGSRPIVVVSTTMTLDSHEKAEAEDLARLILRAAGL